MPGDARPTQDAVLALRRSGVQVGQRWRGFRGATYQVVTVGVTLPAGEPMVGCAGVDGVTWLYHLSMFMGRAKLGSVLVPRFTLCEE